MKVLKILAFLIAGKGMAFSPAPSKNLLERNRACVSSLQKKQRSPFLPRVPRIEPVYARTNQEDSDPVSKVDHNPLVVTAIGVASFMYWYWLVFGAAAKINGLPLVPDFIPMVPGWPPSAEDLQAPLDDSSHFFYLSDLLGTVDAPFVPATRLAVFNIVEAWVFAFLPALWKDPQRLPRPALLGLWAILGINLTNAFLLPYLSSTAVFVKPDPTSREKNAIASFAMGSIATTVAAYALYTIVTMTNGVDWNNFGQTCLQDRTYLAFCVDGVVLSLVQPYILYRAKGGINNTLDYIPFVGLMNFLFR